MWDVGKPGALLSTLEGHSEVVNSVAYSPDGSRLASGSGSFFDSDGMIKLWNVEPASSSRRWRDI